MKSTIAELRTFAFGQPLAIMARNGDDESLYVVMHHPRPRGDVLGSHNSHAAGNRNGGDDGVAGLCCSPGSALTRSQSLSLPHPVHVFMVRQTASQITATRMCTIYAQPNYACGPEDVPRERYIIPGAGDTLSGTRLCRTTGRSSSACTAYGRKCPVHVAPITYKLSDQDGTRVEPAIHENALL